MKFKKLRIFILFSVFQLGFFSSSCFSWANEKNEMKMTADFTLASKYMINGFKVGGDNPVLQISGKTELYSTGVSLMFWSAVQMDRNQKEFDEQDFFVMYSRDFLKDSPYKINLHGYYDYWVFPNTQPVQDSFGDTISTARKQGNKFQAGFSMPQLIPLAESFLVPSYNAYYLHYWEQDREDLYRGGTHHELLVEFFRGIPTFIPRATYQYAGMTAGTNYYDGAFGIKPGFSHTTASLVTGLYAFNSIFETTVNQQWSYEDTVNPDDELWTTLSFIKKF